MLILRSFWVLLFFCFFPYVILFCQLSCFNFFQNTEQQESFTLFTSLFSSFFISSFNFIIMSCGISIIFPEFMSLYTIYCNVCSNGSSIGCSSIGLGGYGGLSFILIFAKLFLLLLYALDCSWRGFGV